MQSGSTIVQLHQDYCVRRTWCERAVCPIGTRGAPHRSQQCVKRWFAQARSGLGFSTGRSIRLQCKPAQHEPATKTTQQKSMITNTRPHSEFDHQHSPSRHEHARHKRSHGAERRRKRPLSLLASAVLQHGAASSRCNILQHGATACNQATCRCSHQPRCVAFESVAVTNGNAFGDRAPCRFFWQQIRLAWVCRVLSCGSICFAGHCTARRLACPSL